MSLVKVIIPIYKTDIPAIESMALKNNLEKLKAHPIVVVCPTSLDINKNELLANHKGLQVEYFSEKYFKSVNSYNRLMLSAEFYERFLDSTFMLICQTDAFVFDDNLEYWCAKDYDYIGGPWLGTLEKGLLKLINQILISLKLKKYKDRTHLFQVGNGGLSLRKVQSAYRIASQYKDLIQSYIDNPKENKFSIEDVFWSLRVPELEPFKIPDYKEALLFAMDRRPDMGMKLTNGKLPFACHGLNKKNIREFWMPFVYK